MTPEQLMRADEPVAILPRLPLHRVLGEAAGGYVALILLSDLESHERARTVRLKDENGVGSQGKQNFLRAWTAGAGVGAPAHSESAAKRSVLHPHDCDAGQVRLFQ